MNMIYVLSIYIITSKGKPPGQNPPNQEIVEVPKAQLARVIGKRGRTLAEAGTFWFLLGEDVTRSSGDFELSKFTICLKYVIIKW